MSKFFSHCSEGAVTRISLCNKRSAQFEINKNAKALSKSAVKEVVQGEFAFTEPSDGSAGSKN